MIPKQSRKKLGLVLSLLFLGVMIMGPGPGLLLVNPDPNDPSAPVTFLGLPIIYTWGLFWYGVQATLLVLAYRFVWVDDDEPEPEEEA